jgi:peroxiredoxin
MAPTLSDGLPVGSPAPPFSLPATDGGTYALEDFADAPVLVVVFTCNHCPYAVAYEDRLIALQSDYADRGVRLVAINSNDAARVGADSFDAMVERAADKGFNFPYLHDETQEVARAYDAACTPEPFVFGPDRTLVYNGRIDDSWQDASRAQQRDLRTVIDRVLAGESAHGLPDVHKARGCSIKWRR